MSGLAPSGLIQAHVWIAALSQTATGSLVSAIWQGILLAVVVGLGLRLLPKTPAAVRFAIWFGVFALVAALPVLSLLRHNVGAALVGRHAWFVLSDRWCLAIAAVWLAASLVRAVSLALAAHRVRALWKRAKPIELNVVAQSGSRRAAQVCTSDEVDRPTVIGFFAPKILIPAWLLEKLTPDELEQIVLHESGHLGRADDWINLLQKIALVVFPLNPAMAWVERRLCFERELAVDERVLQAFAGKAGAATAYAACLATLAEYRLGRRALGLALGALGRESELGRRVGRILLREAGMKPLQSKLVLGGAMLGLLVAATGFEHCPQVVGFAQAGSKTGAAQAQRLSTSFNQATRADLLTPSGGRTVQAFGVVYKPRNKSQMQLVGHEPHQVLAVASLPESRQVAVGQAGDVVQRSAGLAANPSARMVQTSARISGTRSPSRIVSALQPSQRSNVVTQLLVVTAWDNGQSTRMVFTAERMPDGVGQQTMVDPVVAPQAQTAPMDQAPSYAAVPVRGGWLVFQL